MLNKVMMDYNVDIIIAWMTYSAIVLSDVKDVVQIVAGIAIVSYTLWKWKRDSSNHPPKQ